MTDLAHRLGLSETLAFHDIYSLDDADLLSHVPRPVNALLAIIPRTPAWDAARETEDSTMDPYAGSGPEEPVIWFRQTIVDGCGFIGLIHCALNAPIARDAIAEGSILDELRTAALPLGAADRARLLETNDALFEASEASAARGDTAPPPPGSGQHEGQHFVALVKGPDGHLWELEGGRKGPLDRGAIRDDEDALSEPALKLGLRKLIEIGSSGGPELRFSVIALGPRAI